MNFLMDMTIPAAAETIWPIFFDVARVANLIPGCEQVEEKEPLLVYSAVMKQKIGPFRMEAPAEVLVEEMAAPSLVRARARGRDRFTGTTMDVELRISLAMCDDGTRLVVNSTIVVAGRLASLGYSIVKKKVEEMFVEFERRLRAELGLLDASTGPQPAECPAVAGIADAPPAV